MAIDLSFGGGLTDVASSVLTWVIWIALGGGVLIFVAILGRFYKKSKEYNIPITIWIPRSDNKIVDELSAKGGYFKSAAVGGITSFRIKRKGASVVEMPPPESRFLVGLSRHLYLVQKGVDDYEPVLPESFMTVETDKTYKIIKNGKELVKPVRKAVVNLKCKNQDATAWAFDNEENAKRRFTFGNIWDKYKDLIQIAVFALITIIACIIVWKGLQDLVPALQNVADTLKTGCSNAPVVS